MEKIKINTGGQPVYLDDLQLLQDTPRAAMAALISALTGGRRAVLLNGVNREVVEQTDEGVNIRIDSGKLMEDGYIYSFEETTLFVPFENAEQAAIYINLKETDAGYRTMGTGANVATRSELSAVLSLTAGEKSYNLLEVPTLADAVAENLAKL